MQSLDKEELVRVVEKNDGPLFLANGERFVFAKMPEGTRVMLLFPSCSHASCADCRPPGPGCCISLFMTFPAREPTRLYRWLHASSNCLGPRACKEHLRRNGETSVSGQETYPRSSRCRLA